MITAFSFPEAEGHTLGSYVQGQFPLTMLLFRQVSTGTGDRCKAGHGRSRADWGQEGLLLRLWRGAGAGPRAWRAR